MILVFLVHEKTLAVLVEHSNFLSSLKFFFGLSCYENLSVQGVKQIRMTNRKYQLQSIMVTNVKITGQVKNTLESKANLIEGF